MRILFKAKPVAGPLIAVVTVIASSLPLAAQSNDDTFTDLPWVDPTNVPPFATFYSLSTFGLSFENSFGPPTPWNPCADCPVYYLGSNAMFGSFTTNAYVLDDTVLTARALTQMETQDPPPVPPGGGDDPDPGLPTPMDAYSYPSNYLWLSIESASNGLASVTAHGTVPDQIYELLSRERLSDTNWLSEGTFIGAENQDWTPTTIAIGTRTNSLFIWCRSWADSDGDGLPDWWEMQYGLDPNNPDTGNTGIPDGYKNPMNDGWNNIYKYEHGMNPGQFYTPPPPRNVQARLDATGTNVTLTWESGGGPVTNYSVSFTNSYFGNSIEIGQVSADTHTFLDSRGAWNFTNNIFGSPAYQIRAWFQNGSSSQSAPVRVTVAALASDAVIMRGPGGLPFLAAKSLSPAASKLRIYGDFGWSDFFATNFVNGVVPLPANVFEGYEAPLAVQAFATDGNFGETSFASPYVGDEGNYWVYPVTNFVNASVHNKENLKFLLRSATVTQPFSYSSGLSHEPYVTLADPDDTLFANEEYWYARGPSSIEYEYYGYHTFATNRNYSFMEALRPVTENALWQNFVYNPADYGPFGLTNGAFFWSFAPTMRALSYPMKYRYVGPPSSSPPLTISTTNSAWLLAGLSSAWDDPDYDENSELGLHTTATGATNWTYLPSGTRNVFGLPINSELDVFNGSGSPITITAGGAAVMSELGAAYINAESPALQIVDYYFASQTPYFKFYTNAYNYGPQYPAPPFPGSPTFSVTNPLPPRITGLGQPITISGWAKMAITNGYPNKFAYLEQYWDKAYKIGTNGTYSMNPSNETGLLSPYGEFFPTEPGQVAMVTMPDIDTGQRGASLVHVIKLQLDVNHDGAMDLTFGGPDNTSQDRPFVFWVNNDYDRLTKVGSDDVEDDVASTDRKANDPYTYKSAPDCEYRDPVGRRIIPSVRDLEDFARLWIAGVNTNMFASLPADVTAELSWGDKGNPNPKNPTIDIFGTVNNFGMPLSSSGIGYLTNYLTAQHQASNSFTGLRLGPGDSMSVVFSNSLGYQGWNHAIWCGVTRGTGALTLTFSQGTNKIAETSAYIEIKDIKEMYERWTVGDVATLPPTNQPYLATDGLPTGTPKFSYAPPGDTNTPYILLVHDYNLPPWKKDRWAETAFKRLYWHGYQGRFGLFRWPGVTNSAVRLYNSESNAWASATGLLNLLTNLHAQYSTNVYLIAHGYGAVAAGEALRLAETNRLVNTYIAMQGAVPSHAYDSSATYRKIPSSADSGTFDRYSFYNGSASYFAGVSGAGIYINYFNTNDVVLTNRWCSDQDAKCDPLSGFRWDGVNFYRGYFPGLLLLFPQDRYEIFSYADEARCLPIGAQANLRGSFLMSAEVDLASSFSFTNKEEDHGAQFVDNCADLWQFWAAVLGSLGL